MWYVSMLPRQPNPLFSSQTGHPRWQWSSLLALLHIYRCIHCCTMWNSYGGFHQTPATTKTNSPYTDVITLQIKPCLDTPYKPMGQSGLVKDLLWLNCAGQQESPKPGFSLLSAFDNVILWAAISPQVEMNATTCTCTPQVMCWLS